MAKRSDITEADEWFRGEKKTLRWVVDDGGNPASIPAGQNTWTTVFVMRMAEDSPTVYLQLDGECEDPSEGLWKAEVVHGDTVGIPWGVYKYTFARVDPGFEQILAFGDAVLQAATSLRGVQIGAPTAGAGSSV